MICLNCGKENSQYLCTDCQTPQILDQVYNSILSFLYDPEKCENKYIIAIGNSYSIKKDILGILPEILDIFSYEDSLVYHCLYYRHIRDKEKFMAAAEDYLDRNSIDDPYYQSILYSFVNNCIPGDWERAEKWCEKIYDSNTLSCDLYALADKFFAMIGDYSKSEELNKRAYEACFLSDAKFLFTDKQKLINRLEKQKADTIRYRSNIPYWPKENKDMIIRYYDKMGIDYSSLLNTKPKAVKQSDFKPIKEFTDELPKNFCTFWCTEVFGLTPSRCICEIAAAKVENGRISATFNSFVKPWDSKESSVKSAANDLGISYDELISAPSVSDVMPMFFEFTAGNVLVSTDSLGSLAKLLCRATRYAGIDHIDNPIMDLLDYAADISDNFDMENNNRDYLLKYFSLTDGKNALEKAKINVKLATKLQNYNE